MAKFRLYLVIGFVLGSSALRITTEHDKRAIFPDVPLRYGPPSAAHSPYLGRFLSNNRQLPMRLPVEQFRRPTYASFFDHGDVYPSLEPFRGYLSNRIDDDGGIRSRSIEGINDSNTASVVPLPSNRPCRFFARGGRCHFGDHCRFAHNTPPHLLRFSADSSNEEQQQQLRKSEIAFIKRRFPQHSFDTFDDVDRLGITFSSTDPDWPFDVKAINLEICFPSSFPVTIFEVDVVGPMHLPELLKNTINKQMRNWLNERYTVQKTKDEYGASARHFLLWLDRRLMDMFVEGLRAVRLDMQAKAAGISVVPLEQKSESLVKREDDRSNAGSTEVGGSDLVESSCFNEKSADDAETKSVDGAEKENSARELQKLGDICLTGAEAKGTEIRLTSFVMEEQVASLSAARISLILECCRCGKKAEKLCRGNGHSLHFGCAQCSASITVGYRSALVHPYSRVLGYLDLDGCQAIDLILQASEVTLTCLGCNKDTVLKCVPYGCAQKTWCHQCHARLDFRIDSARFIVLDQTSSFQGRSTSEATTLKKKSQTPQRDSRIKEGEPLPADGTCKHYKKSYRWFRFPCCGKVYPCDVCHEETEIDHEMKVANRIVCGFCAKEQPFQNDRPCINCKGNVVRKKSAHWEGGKGCRNNITMSKNDSQKFTNKSKTISRNKQATTEEKKKKHGTK